MDKLKMHSPDGVAANIDRLAELFPGCVTETRDEQGALKRGIDFDLLRQALSDHLVEGPQERYRLDWPGKREALLAANAPIAKTLRPCREESVDFDCTQNLFIEGDNLEALKLLQETYLGKVKLIYIDPPYNTGNDYIYDDRFSEEASEYWERSMQVEEGERLVANLESNGRIHSDWLSMMYSRITLAKNLLCDEGVIVVSIGPEELANTIRLLDESLGSDNQVSVVTWERGRKNDSSFFSESVDYLVIYARAKQKLAAKGKWREEKPGVQEVLGYYDQLVVECGKDHPLIEERMREYYASMDDEDPRYGLAHFKRSDDKGLFFGADISSASTSIPDYDIVHPVTGKPVKKPARGWGATEEVMKQRISEGLVLFGPDESTIPLKKSYLADVTSTVKTPVLYKDGRAATGVLKGMFGDVVFSNPKDHLVLADIFAYCLQGDSNALIIDFFAGSGSTAHAVWELNKQDSGNRSFVLVQIPEEIDPAKARTPAAKVVAKAAVRFLESIGRPKRISEICKERLRRSAVRLKQGDTGTDMADHADLGFRVLKIDTSNMAEVYYRPDQLQQGDLLGLVDNIRPERSAEDLLFQVLLDWGVDLGLPIAREDIAGREVFFVDGDALAACFVADGSVDEGFVRELAQRKPLRAVFRDRGFASDNARINAEQIFKAISPNTEVRTL